MERVGIDRIAAYEHALWSTPRRAGRIPGVRIIGTAKEKASVLSFVLAATIRWRSARRSTRRASRCAPDITARSRFCGDGLEATVRPSFAFYNTLEEIDVFLKAVRRIAEGGANVG